LGEVAGAVGSRVARVEDGPLLRGEALFCDDIELPDLLEVALHRSLHAHARLRSVDLAAAQAIEGVEAVLTCSDVDVPDLMAPLSPPGQEIYSTPRPLLARDVVRYVGEPIAVALAASRYTAEDAAEAVFVEYEELPVLTTVEAAIAPNAPLLHPIGSNVLFEHSFDSGGVDLAIERARHIVERTFRIPRLAPAPLETRGIVADPRDGTLEIWYSTQTPYVLQRVLAELLQLDAARIRVVCPYVGGGFGQKSHVYPEDVLVPWLALRLGRPIRWTEDRMENLTASCHARGQVVKIRAAIDEEGHVEALEADVTVDVGAYGIHPHGQLLEALGTPIMITGPYRISELRFHSRAVATNKCPGGGYRGVGLASAVFVHERLMDIVAEVVGLDPAEIRQRNLIRGEELPRANPVGLVYDSGDYHQALETALHRIGADELGVLREKAADRGKLLGLGLCSYVEYTGMGSNVFQGRGMVMIAGHEEARISIEPDGRALVRTSVPSTGQGTTTALAQIAADALGLDVADVVVAPVATDSGAEGSGAFGSRGTVVGGSAVLASAATLRQRLLEIGSQVLEVSPDDLELVNGAVQARGAPSHRVTYAALVDRAPAGYLDARGRHDPEATTFSYGTHACLVEVDASLGDVRVERYVIVEDCGRVVNPTIVEGQAHGSTLQGIGAALLERVVFDEDGQPLTASFVDYLLPEATDAPRFEVVHLEHPPPHSLGGFKGAGEAGTVAGPAAVANAAANALGAEVNELPITPERVVALARGPERGSGRG
jgi:aerobic carbon-monoxide dehydrogenase large subunit